MRKWNWKRGILLLLLLATCSNGEKIVQAEEVREKIKDETEPKITYTLNRTEPTNDKVQIEINVQDTSEIESVKWASGSKKVSYFLENGKNLTLKSEVVSVSVKKNGTYSFYAKDSFGNETVKKVKITNIDQIPPVISASYRVMEQVATVTVDCEDKESGIQSLTYLKGDFDKTAKEWENGSAKFIENNQFTVKENGTYTILAEDMAGNKSVFPIEMQKEFRAVWISYLEFSKTGYTKEEFKAHIDKMYDNCVAKNMNTVIVQIRPFSDAFYPSKYFPWSVYTSGAQGKNPGYDPLAYMVEAAHKRGLEFHAWVNPYRITSSGTNINVLSSNHPARKWKQQEKTKRNVLTFNGSLYYNPSSKDVQNLIINGIKEIVNNYDVDGIHFDDYFYPTLGTSYQSNFDAEEYNIYKADCIKKGTTPKTIVNWRRSNVNTLVKRVYQAIKKIDETCVFGISPSGSLSNLYRVDAYYVDVKLWLKSSNYIDYICPQLYWSFENKVAPYGKMLEEWLSIKKSDTVNLYVGLAVYRAGISKKEAEALYTPDLEWATSTTVLKRQVEAGRNSKIVDGFALYRYDNIVSEKAKKEMGNLLGILD